MKKDKKTYVLALSIVLLGMVLFLSSGRSPTEITATEIVRNNPGKGSKNLELGATIEDIYIGGIDVRVDERDYTTEECEKLFERCRDELIKAVLAENTDLIDVKGDLNFIKELKGYPFSFEYETDAPDKINSEGLITDDKAFSAIVRITGNYGEYSNSLTVKVNVNPGRSIQERVYKRKLLRKVSESGQGAEVVTLPTEVDGKAVKYSATGKEREPLFILLGFVGAAAVVIGSFRDEKAKKIAYKKAIMKEYPTVLKKISLYLSSGMNLRNIWQTVYEEGVEKKGKDSPFYKEMGISVNELASGISEGLVYQGFGERINEPEIIRFTALLSQNLRKGSSKLKELLNEEVSKAFMDKKQRAIKEGEEAGTKMLLPMVLLLIDVMIIIVIPAFKGI
ncbi:MAG: hypothetical protein IKR39_08025 [Lachnospiraceae bacterium]|nr:hypothetical protein [Lachnospiraceae bacterium]